MIEAESAAEALEAPEQHREVTVLFTDIHMPGPFDGMVSGRKVHERLPDIQLIIASGKARPTKAELPDSGTFFAKTYDRMAIARSIQAASRITQGEH